MLILGIETSCDETSAALLEDGRVIQSDWEEKDEGLSYVNILKTDEMEAKILSGEDQLSKAAVRLAQYGVDEIVITCGSSGSLVYSKGRFYSIPPFPAKKIGDATGCGDTYMAGYIYKRLASSDINESGRFAAAAASLKLERTGPFQGSEADVQNVLKFKKARAFPDLPAWHIIFFLLCSFSF